MAENVQITPGSGDVVAADQVTDGTLGTAKVQYVKLMDGAIAGTNKAGVSANGLKVDGSAVTQPVSLSGNVTVVQPTGTNLHAVLDSGTLTTLSTLTSITNPVTVAQSTAANLNATVVGSGNFTVVQSSAGALFGTMSQGNPNSVGNAWPVEITDSFNGVAAIKLGSTAAVATDKSFVVALSPNSALPAGSNALGSISVSNFPATQPISGSVTVLNASLPVTQSGSWTVTANAGTNLNTSLLALDTSVNGLLLSQGSTTSGQKGTLHLGAVTTAAPTYVTAQSSPLSLNTAGGLRVDGSGVTQPISGTVSLSGTSPISGTVTAVQPTGTNLHVVVDSAPTTAVTGTFFQATQPVSLTSTTITGTVAVTESGTWTVQPGNTPNTTPWLATISQGGNSAVVDATGDLQVDVNNPVQVQSSTLIVTATAATGVAVTATLPAVAAQFQYISFIEIVKYFTVANAASATPLVVTTTNLPGSLAFTFGQPLGTVGTTDRMLHTPNSPLHSSTVNTATTIVCPATTGIIWRVNVYYFTAA